MPPEKEMGVHVLYDPLTHSMTLHIDCGPDGCTTICMPFAEFARLAESMVEAVQAARDYRRAGRN